MNKWVIYIGLSIWLIVGLLLLTAAHAQTCNGEPTYAERVVQAREVQDGKVIEMRGAPMNGFMKDIADVLGKPSHEYDLIMVVHVKDVAMIIVFFHGCEVDQTKIFPLILIQKFLQGT